MYKNEEQKLMTLLVKRIVKLRKERKLTQDKISELIGVYREHIAKVETGKRNVTLKLLFRICISLNITLKDLVDFEMS